VYTDKDDVAKKRYTCLCQFPRDDNIEEWYMVKDVEERLSMSHVRFRVGDIELDIDIDSEMRKIDEHVSSVLEKIECDLKMSLLTHDEADISDEQIEGYKKDLLSDKGREQWDDCVRTVHERFKRYASEFKGYSVYNNLIRTMNGGEDNGDS
jgi:hypothetical protein